MTQIERLTGAKHNEVNVAFGNKEFMVLYL